MVNLVLGGVGRPGLEPGTNALKGQRGGPPRFGMGRQGSARGSARSFSGPEPQIRPQQPEPASVSIARYSGTGPVESRRVGMSKVSKKCPSRHSLGWRKASIYEGAGSRIRTDDLLLTNQSLFSRAGISGRTFGPLCNDSWARIRCHSREPWTERCES